jgi:hypothetical protein
MAFTHTIVKSYRSSIATVETSTAVTGDVETNLDVTVTVSAVNQLAEISLTRLNMKSFSFSWTGTDTLTISTNAALTGSPQEVIKITAAGVVTRDGGTPFDSFIAANSLGENAAECQAMFGADVTALYFSSPLGGTFKMMSLSNTTP